MNDVTRFIMHFDYNDDLQKCLKVIVGNDVCVTSDIYIYIYNAK